MAISTPDIMIANAVANFLTCPRYIRGNRKIVQPKMSLRSSVKAGA